MRASISETITGDYSRGNQTHRHGEAPVDRTMAAANTLTISEGCEAGLMIKRVRANRKPRDIATVVMALDNLLLDGADRGRVEAINSVDRLILATMQIEEWLEPRCRTCNGQGSMHLPGMERIDCHACNASRLQRYTDDNRAGRFGQPLTDEHKWYMTAVSAEIAHYDMVSDEAMKDNLWRDEVIA